MLIRFLISFDSGQNKIGGQYLAVPQWFSGRLSNPQDADDNPIMIVQALDVCRNVMTVYWYHSFKAMRSSDYRMPLGWLRLVHFDRTTMILQGGDGPLAVRWCTITLQHLQHWIPYRPQYPQYLVFLGNEIKPRFPHQIRHNSESNVTKLTA